MLWVLSRLSIRSRDVTRARPLGGHVADLRPTPGRLTTTPNQGSATPHSGVALSTTPRGGGTRYQRGQRPQEEEEEEQEKLLALDWGMEVFTNLLYTVS